MDSKVDKVLREIEEQEEFENQNPHSIPNPEKVLAIGRDTGIFFNILLQTTQAKKFLK